MSPVSVFKFFIILAAYYIAAWLGSFFNIPPGFTTALAPAAGVALASLILCGWMYWPSIFLGSMLFLFLNSPVLFQNLSLPHQISAKLILSLGMTLQALLGVLFVKRTFPQPLSLVHPREVIKFVILTGPGSCLVSSVTGIFLLLVYNQIDVNGALLQFAIWWLGQCFGVFMVAPMMLAMFGTPRNIWQRRRNLIVWPMSLAFFVLIIGFNFFKQLEISRIKGTFEKQVETIHQLLERELYHYIDVLYALESFYSSSLEVDSQEFKLFTSHYLAKFSGIKALQWLPYITPDQRTIFENKIKEEIGTSEFSIFEYNKNGNKKVSGAKNEYFPIEYIEPSKNNHDLIGYDVSSQADYNETLLKARDWGVPIAASVLNLESPLGDQRLLVFFPVYKNGLPHNSLDQRRKNLHGFIIGEFVVNEIVKTVTAKFESSKFILEAYDITKLQPTDLVDADISLKPGVKTERKIFKEYRKLKVVKFFNVAGRRWEVNYSPTDLYIQEEQSWNLWFVLIGGVGFTSFLSVFFLIISGRTTEVEELVKEKTDELKNREERFDLAIQGSSDGLWDWYNLEKDDQWWSPKFYELIGYTPQEIKSSQSSFMGLIHSEDRHKVIECRQAHFENGKPYQVEFRLLHKLGQYRWCRVEGKAYKNERNQYVRMAGSLVDITHQKEIEAALKDERQKAYDLKEAAKTAVKLKQEFLANLSHEIRSPMNSILGFSELLGKTNLDDKQRNYLDTIESSSKYLLDLMNDLFDFSRLEKGQVLLETIEFDLEYLLNHLIQNIALKLKELPVSTYLEIDQNVPRKLLGDATRIRQILTHLLSNAVKFTRQGEIGIRVSLAQESQHEDVILKFRIRDTGTGISTEKQKVIFESFSYAETSTERQSEGLGLGLAICKKMVEIMGGEIHVVSERGKGSEFVFTLKLKKSLMPNVAATWLLKSELRNRKVFILDNNRKSQEIVYQYCRDLGLDVVGFADFAKAALNKMDALCQTGNIPEVIICEMMMSGMEPEDFVKKIKSQPLCQSIKLVAITSNAQPGAARFVQERGFDAYLSKPVNRQDIEGVLRVLLSQHTEDAIFVTRHLVKEMSCQGIRVLVAEDNAADRELMKEFFENLECEGEFVHNGEEAVAKIKSGSFDLCLMDVQMPVMDGVTATQIVRRENKNIPIIALTMYATKEEQERCLQSGMNYFLTKPVNIIHLREVIVRYGRKKSV